MGSTNSWSSEEHPGSKDGQEKLDTFRVSHNGLPTAHKTGTLARKLIEATDTIETHSVMEVSPIPPFYKNTPAPENTWAGENHPRQENPVYPYAGPPAHDSIKPQVQAFNAAPPPNIVGRPGGAPRLPIDAIDTHKMAAQRLPFPNTGGVWPQQPPPSLHIQPPPEKGLKRGQAILFIVLLCILVLQATSAGLAQITGAQGWAYVLGGPTSSDPNLLKNIGNQLHATPGTQTAHPQLTPQQYIDLIVQHMTPDQKLGQLMIVQFLGSTYSLDLSTMIGQYGVGSILVFTANNNITDKAQIKGLIAQMQQHSTLPLAISIDQEGGQVDRLINLDGPQPSATSIGASGDPNKATQQGVTDATNLTSYGFNLNLAPVVDVNNVYNPQMYLRTFGTTADVVTSMAGAYLQGLQQSGKVIGTLKHFPGLGDVASDPHTSIPLLTRTKDQLEQIDWAPYRQLIKQGNVHAIMVTHELVQSIDPNTPSSLSPKIVQGILRDEMGFQGVIMTDSLTMDAVTAYYTEGPAAALAIEAGCDLLMGASSPADVVTMIDGIKQAISAGNLSWQRIDESVRRVLMMKYEMGLLPIPKS